MEEFDTEHHQPRRIDKRKHHRPGFSEDVQDQRANRVSFKNYLREIEETENTYGDEIIYTLSDDDISIILEDFEDWANGVELVDHTDTELHAYANMHAPVEYNSATVVELLIRERDNARSAT